MNKQTIERISVFALAAFLIGYFVYQVAYGGPNGTMNLPGMPGTSISAPPGTNVTHFGIIPEQAPIKWTNFTNSTWTMYNGSSGSSSTITFKTTPNNYTISGKAGTISFGENVTTFVSQLNGHTYKGVAGDDNGLIGSTDTSFMLCDNKWRVESGGLMHLRCQEWKIQIVSPNHMEFKDPHGGTIHMI